MSDSTARSVSWVSVAAVFAGFALFLLVLHFFYHPAPRTMPYNVAAETLPADQAWQATPEARKAYLLELRAKQQAQAASYAWVDQSKGVVQLPLDRAMELTVQEINARAKK